MTTTNATATAITIQDATTVALGGISASSGTVVLGVSQDITGAVTQNGTSIIHASVLTASTNNSIQPDTLCHWAARPNATRQAPMPAAASTLSLLLDRRTAMTS